MITVFTLTYVLILFILIHKGKIPNSVSTWITVPVWVIIQLFVLFVPMMIGAPSGKARLLNYSISVIPNVSGTVTEVNVKPNVPIKKGDVLFRLDPRPFEYALRSAKAQLEDAKQAAQKLQLNLTAAEAAVKQATAVRDQAKNTWDRMDKANKGRTKPFSAQQVDDARLAYEANQSALDRAVIARDVAKLDADSQVDGVNTTVARLEAAVEQAKYNLEQSTIVAPSNGRVTALALRVGQRLNASPPTPALNFIEESTRFVSAQIPQIFHRHIKVGHKAEVTFKTRPGKIFTGVVEGLPATNALGEGSIGGSVPSAPKLTAMPFFVRVALDENQPEIEAMPAGAVGTAAIYTDAMTTVQAIQRVTIRITGYTNYIVPQL